MHKRRRVLIRVALAMAMAVACAFAVTGGLTNDPPHHTRHVPTVQRNAPEAAPGTELTYHAMVLDDAGAKCPVAGVTMKQCPVPLVPVDPPIGESTTTMPTGGGVRLVSDISWSSGIRHLPCYCNSGKVLLDVHEGWLQVDFLHGNYKGSSYVQQLYGFFAQPYDYEEVYNYAAYAPQDTQAYSCCLEFSQNVTYATYYDGRIIVYFNCADPYQLAFGKGYLDLDGSGFWGGWVTLDETPSAPAANCFVAYPSSGTNTKMA